MQVPVVVSCIWRACSARWWRRWSSSRSRPRLRCTIPTQCHPCNYVLYFRVSFWHFIVHVSVGGAALQKSALGGTPPPPRPSITARGATFHVTSCLAVTLNILPWPRGTIPPAAMPGVFLPSATFSRVILFFFYYVMYKVVCHYPHACGELLRYHYYIVWTKNIVYLLTTQVLILIINK